MGVELGLGRGPRTDKHKQLNPRGIQSCRPRPLCCKAVFSSVKCSPEVRGRPYFRPHLNSFVFTLIAWQQRNYKVRPLSGKRPALTSNLSPNFMLYYFSQKLFGNILVSFWRQFFDHETWCFHDNQVLTGRFSKIWYCQLNFQFSWDFRFLRRVSSKIFAIFASLYCSRFFSNQIWWFSDISEQLKNPRWRIQDGGHF